MSKTAFAGVTCALAYTVVALVKLGAAGHLHVQMQFDIRVSPRCRRVRVQSTE